MERFKDKVAVVTGAARGMGLATSKRLLKEGAQVVLLDLPHTDGQAQAGALGAGAHFIGTDVSDEASVAAAAALVKAHLGRLDALVNIAGINLHQRIETMPTAAWDKMMAVNVTGMFLCLKHFVPLMRDVGGGAIVNMGSVSAYVGADGYAAYVTSKGAVISLTKSTALEFAEYNIRVNAVAPGWVDTQFTDDGIALADDPAGLRASANSAHLLGRIAQPEEVANAIVFLLSDEAAFITGETLFVDGGFMVKR